ncbi:MAG TPA: PIN domain-containing protein [Candidatus Pacearchaeota archaeon]|jgi:rRNA-processing protein FCF1|nr:PIN domain-containing protein [Candidatus Pacearchaeota archaeon]|tara:strand:- start:174 stop:551 length:378 start_codon:yes stop_codon:yes gene_type:complete
MKVILDTNFLIYCAKEKLDYIEKINNLLNEGFNLVVPEQVIGELKRLKIKAKKGKDKDACDLALKILEKKNIEIVQPAGKSVDDAIIKLAQENSKNIVCTLDREMRWELGRVILVSRGKKLILTR